MKKRLLSPMKWLMLFALLTSSLYGVKVQNVASELNTWYNTSIEEQTDSVEATFTATPLDVNIDSVIGFSDGAADTYSDLGIIVRFAPNGKIDARNGRIYTSSSNLVYEANKVYTFRLEINFDTKKYSIYVTPKGQGEVQIGSDHAFRTEQSALNFIDNMAYNSAVKNVVTVGEVNFSTGNGGNTPLTREGLIQLITNWAKDPSQANADKIINANTSEITDMNCTL